MTREISIPGRYDRIIEVCKFVVSGAEQAGFNEDDLFKIELACDEACTNIIEHAYGAEDMGKILVNWQFTDKAFVITITDEAQPFHPQDVPQPNLHAGPNDIDDLKVGGLGIHFMRKLMDEVHFTIDKHGGNKLVMTKYLVS
jgi:serine/threonine-protein kinase RsbW